VIITNTGTAGAAVFNFTIPRGDTGAPGAGNGDMLAANNLSDLTNVATARTNLGLATVASTGAYSNLTGIPLTFTPSAHTHTKANITDFAHTHLWADITDKPLTFEPSTHTHAYLPLTGGTLTGVLTVQAGSSTLTVEAATADAAAPRIQSYSSKPLYINELGNQVIIGSAGLNVLGNLTQNGTAVSLAGHTHAAGDITSGFINSARLGSGTADSTTYLRGDGTWATPTVGGSYLPLSGGTLTGDLVRESAVDAAGLIFRRSGVNHWMVGYQPGSGTDGDWGVWRFNQSTGAYIDRPIIISNIGNVAIANSLNVVGSLTQNGTAVSLSGHTHDYAASSHTHSYLSLAGGTVSGPTNIVGAVGITGTLTTNGAIYSTGTDATLWFNSRSNLNSNWAWYSQDGFGATLYASGGYGDVATFTQGGTLILNGNVQANGGRISFNNETFTFDGDTVPHYGLGWYADARNTGGSSLALAGYGGLTFITAGAERGRWDATKLNVVNELHSSSYFRLYGGYMYGPSDKEVMRLTDSWLRLNESNSFTSGVYTQGNFRADGSASFLGQNNFGSDGTRYVIYQDGLSIQRYYTDSTPTCVHEYYIDTGTVARPIHIRFHQGSRWYNRLKAENGVLSYVGGADDAVAGLGASWFQGNQNGATNANGMYTNGYGVMSFGQVTAGSTNFPEVVNNASMYLWLGSHAGPYGKQLYFTDNDNLWMRAVTNGTFAGWRRLAYYDTGVGSQFRIDTTSGYVLIGPQNSTYCHFSTDRSYFYFGQSVHTNGEFRAYNSAVVFTSAGYYVNDGQSRLVRDTQGSYGAVSIAGSKNGYAGIRFDSGGNAPYLMWGTADQHGGFYDETNGWSLYRNGSGYWFQTPSLYGIPYATWATYSNGLRTQFSRGTAAPSGGTDGDVYFQYT
jgi:hypothetical protein